MSHQASQESQAGWVEGVWRRDSGASGLEAAYVPSLLSSSAYVASLLSAPAYLAGLLNSSTYVAGLQNGFASSPASLMDPSTSLVIRAVLSTFPVPRSYSRGVPHFWLSLAPRIRQSALDRLLHPCPASRMSSQDLLLRPCPVLRPST
ncbi:unnamed protein product [Lota lota]